MKFEEITRLTLGGREVQHVAVLPEHVNLFNTRNGLNVELLQRALELFVVLSSRGLRLPYDLSTHGPLSTCLFQNETSSPQKKTRIDGWLEKEFWCWLRATAATICSPILLAAAAACSLANFAGSIVFSVVDRGKRRAGGSNFWGVATWSS